MAEANLSVSDPALETTLWGNFPEDLWIEILVRIPAKSLVKFTQVSKSWYALITSTRFISFHLARIKAERSKPILTRHLVGNEKQEHYTLHPDSDDFVVQSSELELPFKSQNGYFCIVGSCNGLLCLNDCMFGRSLPTRPIFVWNPSIHKWIELPLPNIDPYSEDVFLGFGCDLQELDYKVVRNVLQHQNDTVTMATEVYSLKTKRWKNVEVVPPRRHLVISPSTLVLVNGIVHWLDYDSRNVRNLYLGFDLKEETFGDIFLPEDLASEAQEKLWDFSYKDCLAVLMNHQFEGYCNLWVMKDYGNVESWEILFKINLAEGIERVIGFRNSGHCLATKAVDELFVNDPSSAVLVSFDLHNSEEVEDLEIFGSDYSIYADHFLESLVLLEGQCRF